MSTASESATALLAQAPTSLTGRRRLGARGELLLAVLPTITTLLMLALVEAYSHQRLLFASLASSAFLIYLDPQHNTNSVRTLLIAQLSAAAAGFGFHYLLGPGYVSAALAMVFVIGLMIVLDATHPPAVSTALSFAFQGGKESNLLLFLFAVGLVAVLVAVQRISVYVLRRLTQRLSKTNPAALPQ